MIEHGADGELRLSDYDELGGVRGSIDAAIDAAFASPASPPSVPADRAARERLLRAAFVPWLARVDPETDERKRRVARRDELSPETLPLVDRLVTQRLLVSDRRRLDDGTDAVVIEVAHEALLRRWPALVGWLDEDAAALKSLDAVQRAAREWLRHRDAADAGEGWLLHAGERLAAALELQTQPQYAALLGADGARYLTACHNREVRLQRERDERIEAERLARERELAQAKALAEEQARRADEQAAARRRQRRFSFGLGVLLLVAFGAFVLAWQQRDAAEERGRMALSRQIAAIAEATSEADMPLRLLLAASAQQAGATEEARLALQRALSAEPQLQAVLPRHVSKIWSLAISPDGRTLVSGDADGSIHWWDLAAGRPRGPAHKLRSGLIGALAFSPDGTRLASVSDSGPVVIWDVARREPTGTELPAGGRTVAFSPDGKVLAYGAAEGALMLWDITAGRPLREPLRGGGNSVAFSPDGSTLAADGGLGQVTLWNVASGAGSALGERPREDSDVVLGLAFSPDGKLLASAAGHQIRLWSVERREPRGAPIDAHEGAVYALAFRRDGKMLASAGKDQRIRLWQADYGSLRPIGKPLAAHRDRVNAVAFTPDGRRLASGGEDGTLLLWHAEPRPAIGETLEGAPEAVAALAFAPDGRTLAAGGKTIVRWDAATRRPIGRPLDRPGRALAYSPDGRWLAGAFEPASTLWDLSGAQPIAKEIPVGAVGLAFAPDSRRLVLGGRGKVTLWDPDRHAPDGEPLPGPSHAPALAFSADGKRLAVGGSGAAKQDASITIWSLPERRREHEPLQTHWYGIGSLVFTVDGRTLAAAGDEVALFDVDAGTPLGESLQKDSSQDIAYDAGGRLLAFTTDGNHVITVWDAQRRRPLGDPFVTPGSADYRREGAVALSPDGRLLAAIGEGTVLLWPLDADRWKDAACTIAGRNLTHSEWAQRWAQTYLIWQRARACRCRTLRPPAANPAVQLVRAVWQLSDLALDWPSRPHAAAGETQFRHPVL